MVGRKRNIQTKLKTGLMKERRKSKGTMSHLSQGDADFFGLQSAVKQCVMKTSFSEAKQIFTYVDRIFTRSVWYEEYFVNYKFFFVLNTMEAS